jgi:hypothetical protein
MGLAVGCAMVLALLPISGCFNSRFDASPMHVFFPPSPPTISSSMRTAQHFTQRYGDGFVTPPPMESPIPREEFSEKRHVTIIGGRLMLQVMLFTRLDPCKTTMGAEISPATVILRRQDTGKGPEGGCG